MSESWEEACGRFISEHGHEIAAVASMSQRWDVVAQVERLNRWDGEGEPRCVACGEPIQYCQGHGEMADPIGRKILDQHDDEDHSDCNVDACAAASELARAS